MDKSPNHGVTHQLGPFRAAHRTLPLLLLDLSSCSRVAALAAVESVRVDGELVPVSVESPPSFLSLTVSMAAFFLPARRAGPWSGC